MGAGFQAQDPGIGEFETEVVGEEGEGETGGAGAVVADEEGAFLGVGGWGEVDMVGC